MLLRWANYSVFGVNERVMIERLHSIAKILFRLRYVSALLGFAALIYAAYVLLIADSSDDSKLLFAMTTFIWCGLAYSMGTLLNVPPPEVDPSGGALKRFKARLHRFVYWVVAVSIIVLFIVVLLASYQFLRAAMTGA